DRDLLAVPDPARACVLFRQLRLGLRPLEVELAHSFDRRAGEERAVTDETKTVAVARRRSVRLDGSGRPRGRRQRCPVAALAEGDPAERDRGDLLEDK